VGDWKAETARRNGIFVAESVNCLGAEINLQPQGLELLAAPTTI
jgi:hypothetical protein